MPYTAQFFAEKLQGNAQVEYFNPFRNVQIDPSVNLEELAQVAHSFGEIVGLGLRNLANCPVEMNLMPDSTLRWQAFDQKKPYFMATVFSLVLVAFAVGFLFQKLAESKEKAIADLEPNVATLQNQITQFDKVYAKLQAAQNEANQIRGWMEKRYYWGDVLAELRRVLIASEDDIRKKLSAQKPGVEVGIWIEQMTTIANSQNPGMLSPTPADNNAIQPPAGGTPDQSGVITLVCRAVDVSAFSGILRPARKPHTPSRLNSKAARCSTRRRRSFPAKSIPWTPTARSPLA